MRMPMMYWLSISVQDTMIGNIQDATSPKQAWDRLVSADTTNTKARKIQLKNELNTVKKENLSINDYTLKIKGIVESLASIDVQVEDDDKVEVCLRGLMPAYKQFKASIQTRENIPCFANLVPMLVVEEKNIGEDSSSSQGRNNVEQVFYSNRGRGASNHMTNHGEWFKELQALQNPGYVETGDDIAHPIAHTRNVPLSLQDGNVQYLADVLHVPNITKNLVSVGQMVEQGLQVRFNADGLYVEEYKKNGKLIAQGKKVGRMFTLDVNIPEVNTVMFAHGSGVVADIEIWHKRTGHTMYRQIVGSLIYLTILRPDLSYSVGLEGQFMQLPRKPHLDVVRHTLRYVSATLDYALFYEASTELQLSGFTDADWAGSVCDPRSTIGFMFSLGSAAITWSSKK
ncbi:hypothetical protein L7F22_019980 [Adiantum nelumboides]|nr:hypothetical protein [Adiantum nelumboides]